MHVSACRPSIACLPCCSIAPPAFQPTLRVLTSGWRLLLPSFAPPCRVAPALATGNCIVLKPAEQTPLNALRMAAIFEEAGVPAGTINILPGEQGGWEFVCSDPLEGGEGDANGGGLRCRSAELEMWLADPRLRPPSQPMQGSAPLPAPPSAATPRWTSWPSQ